MTQRIILIHGRSTKPAKEQHANLLRQSLLQGLNRVDPEKAEKVALGGVAVDYVYYGDINNKILAEHSQEVRDELTDKDPAFENARCLPITGYPEAIDALSRFKRFNKRAYDVVLAENDSKTWRGLARRSAPWPRRRCSTKSSFATPRPIWAIT